MAAYDTFVFDCDGTLLDTLGDLTIHTNEVLESFGLPTHSREAIKSFVGGGAGRLIDLAVPGGTSSEFAAEVLDAWRERYHDFGYRTTAPYPGVPEMLAELRARGAALGVVSNKFDAATRDVVGRFFPGVFEAVHGEGPGFPRKPDPTGLLATIAELGGAPERTVYVGDSDYDVLVARNAGCLAVGVTWGYNPAETLVAAGADMLVDAPNELLTL